MKMLCLMVATVISAAGCSGPRAAASASAPAPAVAVAKAARADLAQTLTLEAEFHPFQEIDVHAKVAGYLKKIYVDVGDRVKAGQVLAVLEIPELLDDVQQDEAVIRRSTEEINRAHADLDRAQSAHQVAHVAAERLAAVMKERPNLVAQQDIDDATARDRGAEAQVATAKAALAAAEQQLAVSKATANKTHTLLEYARITAPFAGVITHRYADTGAMIQAGTSSQTQTMPLVQLSENDKLRLIIQVPESAVSHIRIGEPVDVRVESLGRTFPGVISRAAGKVNPETRTMETEVDVQNANLALVPGMYAYASIALERTHQVLTVPVQALDRADDKVSVLVVNGGRIERRDVRLGLETPDRVEVVNGLNEGDMVVVGSRSQLRPGAAVTPKVESPLTSEGKS
jgi:RND family efflux transporter MFP subunit